MKDGKALIYLSGFIFCALFLAVSSAKAQPPDRSALFEKIEKEGCAVTDDGKVKICKFNYKYKNKTVEALTLRPVADGKYPSVFLIPGYQGTPRSFLTAGIILGKLGFASMIVGTPGFGKTDLKPEFLGKTTIKAFAKGIEKFARETFVERDKLAVLGYSRGAIAASLLITEVKNLKAAVLGGGIYDLKKAYDELTLEGIRENIKAEAGTTEKSFRERSAIFRVKKINCPVLIVHGELDVNAPPNQAYLLRDKLKETGKVFEFQIVAGKNHTNIGGDFLTFAIDFLSRKLKGISSDVKIR